MFIPGQIISILTFPGVIVHELAHQLFCRLFRVAVFKVVYFQLGNPAGYVIHEPPRLPLHNLMVAVGPFLINTFVGVMIAFPAALKIDQDASFSDLFLFYLGFSIAMHAFPSTGDAASIWKSTFAEDTPAWLKWLTVPVLFLIYAGAIGSVVWLDALYGFAVVVGFPRLLMQIFA